jgi:hypothetical protein
MEAANKFWEGGEGARKNEEKSGAKRASKRRRRRRRSENATTADCDVCNGPLQATIAILARILHQKKNFASNGENIPTPPAPLTDSSGLNFTMTIPAAVMAWWGQ